MRIIAPQALALTLISDTTVIKPETEEWQHLVTCAIGVVSVSFAAQTERDPGSREPRNPSATAQGEKYSGSRGPGNTECYSSGGRIFWQLGARK